MESPLATVNINIGLGNNNPTLTIRNTEELPALVDKLIKDYRLPKTVQPIILQAVNQQLLKNKANKPQQKSLIPTKTWDKNNSVSPKSTRNVLVKPDTRSPRVQQKQNNSNAQNCFNQTVKHLSFVSRSPAKNTLKSPLARRVEQPVSKTPSKVGNVRREGKDTKEGEDYLRVRKLFRFLIKNNPKNIKVLSPEYIEVRGLDKILLGELQVLFELIEEQQFEKMEEQYFVQRVKSLGLIERLGKKDYETCYKH